MWNLVRHHTAHTLVRSHFAKQTRIFSAAPACSPSVISKDTPILEVEPSHTSLDLQPHTSRCVDIEAMSSLQASSTCASCRHGLLAEKTRIAHSSQLTTGQIPRTHNMTQWIVMCPFQSCESAYIARTVGEPLILPDVGYGSDINSACSVCI
jgi:hypothetical protein